MPGTIGMRWRAKGCRGVHGGIREELKRTCDRCGMACFPLHSDSYFSFDPDME